MSWETIAIEELCLKVTSGGTPLRSRVEFYEGGTIPWIKTKEVNFNRIYEADEKITEKGLDNSSAKLIPQNSILIAMYGDGHTAGRCAINRLPVATNQACCNLVINPEKANPDYMFYKISTLYEIFRGLKSGGSQQNLNAKTLRGFKLQVPPLPTQLKIASILSAYDDLIENNLKRIKLLEEQAFLTYKGIVNSEKLEERPILDICYITDGTHDSPKQQVDGIYLVTGKHLIGGSIDFTSAYFISETDHDKIQKRSRIVNGDLVLSNIGTIGNVAIIDSPFEFSVKNVIIFKPNSAKFTSFLYCYLNSVEMQIRFQQESSGTSQRFISLTYARGLKVKLPSETILIEFHNDVSKLLKLKAVLNLQNTKLREARDILLPKLMNGQIEV